MPRYKSFAKTYGVLATPDSLSSIHAATCGRQPLFDRAVVGRLGSEAPPEECLFTATEPKNLELLLKIECQRQMKRGRVIVIGAVIAMVLAGVWLLTVRDQEPTYRGRTVHSWLGQVLDTKGNQGQALEALRAMGAQAVPWEIRVSTQTESVLDRLYNGVQRKLPPRYWKYLPAPVTAKTIRSAAELALLNNRHVGEFIPELVRLLKHRDSDVRYVASSVLADHIRSKDISCVPDLVEALNDPHAKVRQNVARALASIGPAA